MGSFLLQYGRKCYTTIDYIIFKVKFEGSSSRRSHRASARSSPTLKGYMLNRRLNNFRNILFLIAIIRDLLTGKNCQVPILLVQSLIMLVQPPLLLLLYPYNPHIVIIVPLHYYCQVIQEYIVTPWNPIYRKEILSFVSFKNCSIM